MSERRGRMIRFVGPMIRVTAGVLLLAFGLPGGARAQSADDAPYLAPDTVDMLRLFAPPPFGDDALARDLAAVRALQEERSVERYQQALGDVTVSVFRFADVLGPAFDAEHVPITARFFARVNRDMGRFITQTKNCWRRPRPFELDDAIQPTDEVLASTGMRTGAPAPVVGPGTPCVAELTESPYSFSYPSGHTAFGALTAILLAQMVPEKHVELFERGWEYGASRIVAGGRILASVVAALLLQEERFRADLAAARAELRTALGFSDFLGPRATRRPSRRRSRRIQRVPGATARLRWPASAPRAQSALPAWMRNPGPSPPVGAAS